jgi:NADH:ubiquinone oxidoreductase subunit 3 (subunit A)
MYFLFFCAFCASIWLVIFLLGKAIERYEKKNGKSDPYE